ncbi:MAG: hypothetical protein H7338_16715 [Candidatus Sericytochromatia bacterium]|nr:hypothetical protein [Candidatus Sericytochromatia bacterium]
MLGTASPAPFRIVGVDDGSGTAWQLYRPASSSDAVAFDPSDAAQLTAQQIDPTVGDQAYTMAEMSRAIGGLTSGTSPGRRPYRFALDHLIVFPKATSDLTAIGALVGGVIRGAGIVGFHVMTVTPAKGDVSRLATNLRVLSQYNQQPLTRLNFSSINSARVFALYLMLMMERTDLCWSSELDAIGDLP